MGNPEPNPVLQEQTRVQKAKKKKRGIGAETQRKLF